MSVYTKVPKKELINFLNLYDLGKLISIQGITQGVTNSNFILQTTCGKFILTIFEVLKFDEITFFLELKLFLNKKQIACPLPIKQKNGKLYGNLCNKPAIIVSFLNGTDIKNPSYIHCYNVGQMQAKMHLAGKNFKLSMPNPRYDKWWYTSTLKLKDKLSANDFQLLMQEIEFLYKNKNKNLPNGIIHADLFKDNVLIENEKVSGFIDFYYACNGQFIYDIAIAINDWAKNNNHQINSKLKNAYLNGYNSTRNLSPEEVNYLPIALRAASLRFLVSRLLDYHLPFAGEITYIKNPDEFKQLLLYHQLNIHV